MKKQLVVLAAGMGSRYGGLKQMDPVGPSGEFILDYSVFDALRAGFEEVVFVIRRDLETDFRRIVGHRWETRVPVRYAFQELAGLPAGVPLPPNRIKPWGTGHAVLAARDLLDTPFAVVNADDFYGRESLAGLAAFLDTTAETPDAYAMVAYAIGKTLSRHGTVARGVCSVTGQGRLERIVEQTSIRRDADGTIRSNGVALAEETPVSLNLFGFKPGFLVYLAEGFELFLRDHAANPQSEYFIPTEVGNLIREGRASVDVLRTPATWCGVTNAEDRPGVVSFLAALAAQGEYPSSLFAG